MNLFFTHFQSIKWNINFAHYLFLNSVIFTVFGLWDHRITLCSVKHCVWRLKLRPTWKIGSLEDTSSSRIKSLGSLKFSDHLTSNVHSENLVLSLIGLLNLITAAGKLHPVTHSKIQSRNLVDQKRQLRPINYILNLDHLNFTSSLATSLV